MAASKTDKRAECKHMHLSAYPVVMSICHVSCMATFRDVTNSSEDYYLTHPGRSQAFLITSLQIRKATDRDRSMGDLLNQFSIY